MIQEGTLKQLIIGGNHKVSVVSRRDVYIHLFNDLLLLSVRRYDLLECFYNFVDPLVCFMLNYSHLVLVSSVIVVFHTPLSGNRFVVQDHALFPDNVRAEEIKTTILGLPPDSLLLHLTKNHNRSSTALIFAARTR